MYPLRGAFARFVLLALCVVALTTAGFVPAQADDPPAATGKNAKVQLFGVGWMVYRYQLADEVLATAPKATLSSTGIDRKDANSFDLDRVQLSGDYFFNDRITWRTVIEANNTGGTFKIYPKNAFLRVKNPMGATGQNFKFGLFGHGMTGVVDDMWGYRIISENGINRYLGVSSAYVGVGMDGKLANGVVDYDIDITDEQGYNQTVVANEANRGKYKTLMGRLVLTPPGDSDLAKSLHLAVFGQMNGKNPPSADLPKDASKNRNLWWEVFPYFKNAKLGAGFEFANYSNKQTKLNGDAIEEVETKAKYLGGTVTYQATPEYGAFVRVDMFDPDTDNDASWSGTEASPVIKGLSVTNIMAGVSHTIAPGVRAIVDTEISSFEKAKDAAGAELSLDSDVTVTARMEVKL